MKTVVCFRAGGGSYAVPVEATVGVRSSEGVVPLPGARPDVIGLLADESPLSVLAALGTSGTHVLILMTNTQRYGLLVDEVTRLRTFDGADVGEAPSGQDEGIVCGVVHFGKDLVLLVDPTALAARL
jgi:chemotaxis signal transduction protein